MTSVFPKTPLVSVLTTSYNREAYIAKAIESVLAQTMTDFEYIIVDDCSKDRTFEIAQSFAIKDSRIRVYRNDKNLGDYPNRNRAASYAKGKYLKYVDADDYMYPGGLSTMVSMMEAQPVAGYGLCSLPQVAKMPFPILLTPREAYQWHFSVVPIFHKAPLSAILVRKIFEAEGRFPEKRMSSDYEMWLRLSQRFPVLLMPDGIVWYREHGDQEIASYQQFLGQYETITQIYIRSDDCPLPPDDRLVVIKRERARVRKMTFKCLVRGRFAVARDLALSTGLGVLDLPVAVFDFVLYPFQKLFARLGVRS